MQRATTNTPRQPPTTTPAKNSSIAAEPALDPVPQTDQAQTDDPVDIPYGPADIPDDLADIPDDLAEIPDDPGEVFDWEPPADWFIDYSVDPDEEPADPSDDP